MHDRRDRGYDRGGSRHGRDERHAGHGEGSGRGGCDEHCGHDRGSRDNRRDEGDGRRAPRGGGPDTRFLQLEMSQVLYGEAEAVTRQAFRELLLEAAKARFRERFGDKIAGLAELAVDELLNDVHSSLDIEAHIQERNKDRDRTKDRLRDIFAERDPCDEHGSGQDHDEDSPCKDDEGGGDPGSGHNDNR